MSNHRSGVSANVYGSGSANPSLALISRRAVLGMPLLAAPLVLTGCGTETLFSASFNQDTVGLPPGAQQTVGTITLPPSFGAVKVSLSPIAEPNDHWALVQRTTFNDVTAMRCKFSALGGVGQFTASCRLLIPADPNGAEATVQFEAFNQLDSDLKSFLHLDFLSTGKVRANDDGNLIVGTFQKEALISILVSLNITATSATATINLLGAASGSLDVAIPSFFMNIAEQFGAMRIWMGAQTKGAFYVDDISALRVIP